MRTPHTRNDAARNYVICCFLLTGLLTIGCPAFALEKQSARIESIAPSCAGVGDNVTISGRGFGSHNVHITVHDISAEVVAANGNSATFIVPQGTPQGPAIVTATNPGGHAANIEFMVRGPEVCDGIDNNCDGTIDEGIADIFSGTDIGECSVEVQSCIGGVFQITKAGVGAVEEICADGLDQNCDGITDNPEICGIVADSKVTLFSNPGDSRLLSVESPDFGYAEFIGEKSVEGLATQVSHIEAWLGERDEEPIFVNFDSESRLQKVTISEGALEFNWQSNTSVLVRAILADGTEQEDVLVNLPEENAGEVARTAQSTPLSQNFALLGMPSLSLTATESPSTNNTVRVTHCQQPKNVQAVKISATNLNTGISEVYPAESQSGTGKYNVRLPLAFFNPNVDLRENFINITAAACAITSAAFDPAYGYLVCSRFAGPLAGLLCRKIGDVLQDQVDPACNAILDNVDEILETYTGDGPTKYVPLASTFVNGLRQEVDGGLVSVYPDELPQDFSIELPVPPTAIPAGTYEGPARWMPPWDAESKVTVVINSQGVVDSVHYHGHEVAPYTALPHTVTRHSNGDLTVAAYGSVQELTGDSAGSNIGCTEQTIFTLAPSGNVFTSITLTLYDTDPPQIDVKMSDWANTYSGVAIKQ